MPHKHISPSAGRFMRRIQHHTSEYFPVSALKQRLVIERELLRFRTSQKVTNDRRLQCEQ